MAKTPRAMMVFSMIIVAWTLDVSDERSNNKVYSPSDRFVVHLTLFVFTKDGIVFSTLGYRRLLHRHRVCGVRIIFVGLCGSHIELSCGALTV